MDPELHHRIRSHRRRVFVTTTVVTPPQPPHEDKYEEEEEEEEEEEVVEKEAYTDHLLILSKPADWFIHLVSIQVEIISSFLLSLSSPFLTALSKSQAVPSRLAHRVSVLLRNLAFGFLSAVYVGAILLAVMVVAALLGVFLVRLWVEEPVVLREPLHFDYTQPHPTAVVSFGRRGRAIPAGHTVRVSLVLLMPESDFNRHIGVFQVTAEVISSAGDIVAASSQPCMLRFRSLPVRLMRTFVMCIPLLLGISSETQKIFIEILRYKEGTKKTEMIRVRIKPRAGTFDLPQIYTAEILISSQLPWSKELVYKWKWTFYVWISLYMFIILLIVLFCCFKPFIFPRRGINQLEQPTEVEKEPSHRFRDGEIFDVLSDTLRKWRERSRSKGKVSFPHMHLPELVEGSASSTGAGETSEVIEDSGEFAASESSECVGG